MNMRKILIYFFCCTLFFLYLSTGYTQRFAKLRVDSCRSENFNEINGVLWSRNPDIDEEKLLLKEDGKNREVEWGSLNRKVSPDSENKRIVFMLPINYGNRVNALIYKQMLKEAIINKSVIKEGDELCVVKYGEINSKNYAVVNFNGKLNFTDEIIELENQLNDIDQLVYNEQGKEDMLWAVLNVLDALKSEKKKLPTSIFVLSPNTGDRRHIPGIPLVDRCLSQDVSVYGFIYPKDNLLNKGNLETLCEPSFGLLHNDDDPIGLTKQIKGCSQIMKARAAGVELSFRFNTDNENDGKKHSIDVNLEDYSMRSDQFDFSYPPLSIFDWIKLNKVTSLVLMLSLIHI